MSLLLALMLLAQDVTIIEREEIIYSKKTTISFEEGDLIEGELTMPDVSYIEARKRIRFESLIKLRTNFRKRVLRSINHL